MQKNILSTNDYSLIFDITKKHLSNLINSEAYASYVDRSNYRIEFDAEGFLKKSKGNQFTFDFETSNSNFTDRLKVSNLDYILKHEYITANDIKKYVYPLTNDQVRLLRAHNKITYIETDEDHITKKYLYKTEELITMFYNHSKGLLKSESLVPTKQFMTRDEALQKKELTDYSFRKYAQQNIIPIVKFGNAIRIPIIEFKKMTYMIKDKD